MPIRQPNSGRKRAPADESEISTGLTGLSDVPSHQDLLLPSGAPPSAASFELSTHQASGNNNGSRGRGSGSKRSERGGQRGVFDSLDVARSFRGISEGISLAGGSSASGSSSSASSSTKELEAVSRNIFPSATPLLSTAFRSRHEASWEFKGDERIPAVQAAAAAAATEAAVATATPATAAAADGGGGDGGGGRGEATLPNTKEVRGRGVGFFIFCFLS